MKKGIILIAVLVAALAVTSGAFAAQHYLITSSSQIKNGVVSLADLSPAALKAMHATAGPAGPAGAQGPKGDRGATGATGGQGQQGTPAATGYEVNTWRYSKDDAATDMGPDYPGVGSGAIATVACSPGKVAIGGGYRFTSDGGSGFNSQALRDGSGVVASFPGRMNWSTNTVKPNDNSGWIVQVNDKVNSADMTLYVICVNAR